MLLPAVHRSTADCSKNNTAEENDNIEFSAQGGHLTSPGYPAYFSDNIQCTWLIYVARRHSIQLEFEFFDFGLSQPCSASQESSFLEVRDGASSDSEPLGIFCGKTKPGMISSSGRNMWIRFKANGYRSAKFKASYTALRGESNSVCVRLLLSVHASLQLYVRSKVQKWDWTLVYTIYVKVASNEIISP